MNILFLVVNNYPNGDAGSIRQHSFAAILRNFGHHVTIVCVNQSESIDFNNFEGIDYKSIKGKYFETKKQLINFFKKHENPEIIFLNTIPINSFIYVKKYAKKNKITLIHDCVEWYSLKEFSLNNINALIRGYFFNNIVNQTILDKNFKVISISSYLDSYFLKKNIKSIRIPVIMDVDNIHFSKMNINNQLKIMYAGSPSKKDHFKIIIKSLELMSPQERELISFDIFGLNLNQFCKIVSKKIDEINYLKCIRVLGRVSRSVVLKHLMEVDFTILIRPEKARYAKAGFPTKVVESLASGTPIITNLTSDLHMYLIDSENSLISKSSKINDVLYVLRRAINLTIKDKHKMSLNARKTAEEYFNYKNYSKLLNDFIQK